MFPGNQNIDVDVDYGVVVVIIMTRLVIDHRNATITRRKMRKLLTNDSNEADHRDEDAIAGVLIPLDNLAIQNCNKVL